MREASEDKSNHHTQNILIGIGVTLVMVPNPHVKILGVVTVGVGLGFEIYDQYEQRRS
ncbi:MAG: hypothetical protein OXF95_01075 [Rhodobacteraceae bacterium]|nr:hypothetical protein [Paracoccaceae bacterium]